MHRRGEHAAGPWAWTAAPPAGRGAGAQPRVGKRYVGRTHAGLNLARSSIFYVARGRGRGGAARAAMVAKYACNLTPRVYSTGATKLIGLVGGPSAREVESDSDELSSKDGR